jgi:hypothetical protein
MRFIKPGTLAAFTAVVVAVLAAGCAGPQASSPASFVSSPQGIASVESAASVKEQIANGSLIQACHDLTFGQARCMTLGLRDHSGAPRAKGAGNVAGWGPADLQAAYNIVDAAKHNPGGTVAVIEAGGNPNLESDLKVYRKQFGLSPCTTVNKCLRILNQRGSKGPLPAVDDAWLAEQSLDVDMVSANCPNCKIVVIQCSTNLYTGIQAASRLTPAPVAISNSWGGDEYPNQYRADLSIFNHPGIAITASTGDGGYGTIFPSTSPKVPRSAVRACIRQRTPADIPKRCGPARAAVAANTPRFRSGKSRSSSSSEAARISWWPMSRILPIPTRAWRFTKPFLATANRRAGRCGAVRAPVLRRSPRSTRWPVTHPARKYRLHSRMRIPGISTTSPLDRTEAVRRPTCAPVKLVTTVRRD